MNNDTQKLEARLNQLETQFSLFKSAQRPRINLGDLFPTVVAQNVNGPFQQFMMWGSVTLSGGTGSVTDTRIKSTSTVVIGQNSNAVTVSVTPAAGSVSFSASASSTAVVYYIIIF